MLRRNLTRTETHRYVRYGRMSSDMQNPRSPDQQFESIDRTLRIGGYTWSHA